MIKVMIYYLYIVYYKDQKCKNGINLPSSFLEVIIYGVLWIQGVFLESPPSFCNGLRTIYIASFRGRTFDLTTRV